MGIGKTPKKLDSIYCPQCRETKSDTLKGGGEGREEGRRNDPNIVCIYE
jgi:hypothetical protein